MRRSVQNVFEFFSPFARRPVTPMVPGALELAQVNQPEESQPEEGSDFLVASDNLQTAVDLLKKALPFLRVYEGHTCVEGAPRKQPVKDAVEAFLKQQAA